MSHNIVFAKRSGVNLPIFGFVAASIAYKLADWQLGPSGLESPDVSLPACVPQQPRTFVELFAFVTSFRSPGAIFEFHRSGHWCRLLSLTPSSPTATREGGWIRRRVSSLDHPQRG
jgi:hypothetical protein